MVLNMVILTVLYCNACALYNKMSFALPASYFAFALEQKKKRKTIHNRSFVRYFLTILISSAIILRGQKNRYLPISSAILLNDQFDFFFFE